MPRFFHGRPRSLRTRVGTVLLLVVVLSALLSGLVLLAATELALDRRSARYVTDTLRVFYIAESGLARARAYLESHGPTLPEIHPQDCETEPGDCSEAGEESPFDRWIPFEGGRYRVRAYDLSEKAAPYLERDSGILLVSTGSVGENLTRRLCLLLDGPPDWDPLAWWEPEQ